MNIAVIFAGGSGQRMHTKDVPKQFLLMHSKPIIIYTLEWFDSHPEIDAVVVACKEDTIEYLNSLIYKYRLEKVKKVVPGGATGQMSIYRGLCAAKEVADEKEDRSTVVLIHDGVRPMINHLIISENIKSVKEHGSAITTGLVTETILVVDDDKSIDYVPDRLKSRVAKAPQSFWLDDILTAHRRAQKEGMLNCIDSCTMMKRYGHPLYLVDGPNENIKITTQSDFYTMRAYLDAREDRQLYEGEFYDGRQLDLS